ncbi:MAG: ATP-binding protein [Chloroflexota bacterium]
MRCPSCGADADEDARFCARCGASIRPADSVSGAPGGGTPPPEGGDRRVVTALFADLVDYVRMLAEHDPEDVRARVTSALMTMASAIERFEGTREKFIGDAVFAVFGWPRAHDDDAVRAALAALAIRSGLQEAAGDAEPLDVRIGLATGEVVAGASSITIDRDLRLTGEAITTAARIQSMARAGEILLDDATLRAARGRLATEARGAVVLRGQSTSIELHALRGEAGVGPWVPFRTSSPDPLVGRTAELEAIGGILDQVQRTGHGAALLIEGEAGVGKSRLLQAVEGPARGRDFAWSWTENVSYAQNEPYRWARLLAQVIADEHGVDSGTMARRLLFTDDLPESERRRFGGAIAAIARDAAFSGWEAEAADTPNDPAEVSSALGEVASTYIDRLLAVTGPRVVVIDDLQWLDPSSVGMVDLVIERCASHPLVVIAASRPGPLPLWAVHPDVRHIRLTGLDEPETARLATIVARAALDADGARSIHERTAGNPLFVGETVRAFLEDGTLQWRDGVVALSGRGGTRLPITLRTILGARIDALPPGARDALGVASVIGISFRRSTVEALLDGPLAADAFEQLAASALVAPLDDDRWRFAHALIHDTMYAGLLASRRRVLHERLADRLERGPEPSTPSQIAAHRVAAGDVARAIPLLREAAESALGLGAVAEAAASWRQAADLAAADDPVGAEIDRARAEEAIGALETPRQAMTQDEGAPVREAPAVGPS